MKRTADTVIVLAKEPRPGLVKTRLQAAFTPAEAADLAAAAIADTLAAARATGLRRLLALDGSPTTWMAGWPVAPQPGGDLNTRLTAAFAAAFADPAAGAVLLIGMDTPQVTPADLIADWRGADAVLGLSEDGGFWAIGLRAGHPAGVFDGIPMSTDRTGAAQLARLYALGLTVTLLDPLRDIDLPADAEAVATAHPRLRFAQTWRSIVGGRPEQSWASLFDRLYASGGVASDGTALVLEADRWFADPDGADQTVLARCRPPVLDLGCGPGRMVSALTRSGQAALGIDISASAVRASRTRGGPALRRLITDRLPAEGRWGTVLLMDGNLGIGGDVAALLRRCTDLVGPGGLILAEADPRDGHQVTQVVLTSDDARSDPMPWARMGAADLISLAAEQGLTADEQWTAAGRCFVALRTPLEPAA